MSGENCLRIKNKVVVFGADGTNALGLVRSLGQKGLFVVLLLRCNDKGMTGRSKYVGRLHLLADFNDGIRVLLGEYANEPDKPIVFPAGDHEVAILDANYNRLKDHFVLFNVKRRQGEINYYLDKIKTFPLAQKCGLKLIKTWILDDVHKLPSDLLYPCMIKGGNSTSSDKTAMYICNDRDELNKNLHEGIDYLVQEYIKREYELCVIGLSLDGGHQVHIPAVVHKIRDGLRIQGTYMRLTDVREYPDLPIESISQFVRELGYEGIFSVEFLYARGCYYFLEINLRNDGCCYLYTKAGINYPYWWVVHSAGGSVDSLIAQTKYSLPLYLISSNDLFYLVERKISIWKLIRDFSTVRAFYVMSIDDPWPFIFSLVTRSMRVGKRLILRMIRCSHESGAPRSQC